MKIRKFKLEEYQVQFENIVDINLTSSGVHAITLADILSDQELNDLANSYLGYGYTRGSPQLRENIAQWYPSASQENILVTHGACEANQIALLTLATAGDHMIFVTPNFMQLNSFAESLGIEVTEVKLNELNGWLPDLNEIENSVKENTKLITFSNPNNPTGAIFPEGYRRAIIEIAERRGITILSDEVYRGSEINREVTPSFFGEYSKTIVTSSISKSFASAGLRLGWIVSSPKFIDACGGWLSYTSTGTSPLCQRVGEIFMRRDNREKLLQRSRQELCENLKIFESWMGDTNIFTLISPQGGGVAFPKYHGNAKSHELVIKLIEYAGVFIAAGSWFDVENHFRIGIGSNKTILKEGLSRIADHWSKLI